MVGGQESEQARIANGLLARFEGEPYIIQPDLLAERLPWQSANNTSITPMVSGVKFEILLVLGCSFVLPNFKFQA